MVNFILRFALLSILGMFFHPGQLSHQLPTPGQINGLVAKFEHGADLRNSLIGRIGNMRRDTIAMRRTAVELQGALVRISRDLTVEARSTSRTLASE